MRIHERPAWTSHLVVYDGSNGAVELPRVQRALVREAAELLRVQRALGAFTDPVPEALFGPIATLCWRLQHPQGRRGSLKLWRNRGGYLALSLEPDADADPSPHPLDQTMAMGESAVQALLTQCRPWLLPTPPPVAEHPDFYGYDYAGRLHPHRHCPGQLEFHPEPLSRFYEDP